jgi:hypothetical protein
MSGAYNLLILWGLLVDLIGIEPMTFPASRDALYVRT